MTTFPWNLCLAAAVAFLAGCGEKAPAWEAAVRNTQGATYTMDCYYPLGGGRAGRRSLKDQTAPGALNIRSEDLNCSIFALGGRLKGPLTAELVKDGRVVGRQSIPQDLLQGHLGDGRFDDGLPRSAAVGSDTITLGAVKAKVGPLVELSATPKGEPGRFDRLGASRFYELSALDRWAALYVASSPDCDRLNDMDTRASTRKELVWRGRCDNGNQFIVFEMDVKAARTLLTPLRDASKLENLESPNPRERSEFDEDEFLRACAIEINKTLRSGESYAWDSSAVGRRRNRIRTIDVLGNVGKTAFDRASSRFQCDVDADRLEVVKLRARRGARWEEVLGPGTSGQTVTQ